MSKKAQEEIIGFVVIVVVVMIVLLVFLTFIFKNPEKIGNEEELKNFIDSIVLYTTSCEQDTGFLELKELIIACNNNEQCLEGRSCDVLNKTMVEILGIVKVGSKEEIKGQDVSIFYRYKDSTDNLINIKRGLCQNNTEFSAVENVYPAGEGVVGLRIRECY